MKEIEDIHTMTAHLFRENSGKMTSVLSRLYGLNRIESILDVVQDTFEAALIQWKFSGIPENPSGWLMRVAKNKAVNKFLREGKTTLLETTDFFENHGTHSESEPDDIFSEGGIKDSQLRMLLTCCHPEFSERNQILLTLHILCGFGVKELARGLLMNPETVKKALSRCKTELKKREDIFSLTNPYGDESRIATAQTILYLMFNEGYKTTYDDDLTNTDLCYEAIRLCKLLMKSGTVLLQETFALCSLMFFNLSRFPSRLNENGEIVTLQQQDRSKWSKIFIEEGCYYLNLATRKNELNRFVIEAIISSIHCTSKSFAETDWKTILYLYEQLEKIQPSPMITLNKIVTSSFIDNTSALLAELEKLKTTSLRDHFLLHAAEGDLLKRSGRNTEALSAYEKASRNASSPLDKAFLNGQILQCKPSIN